VRLDAQAGWSLRWVTHDRRVALGSQVWQRWRRSQGEDADVGLRQADLSIPQ
jgi:hypothetical protein